MTKHIKVPAGVVKGQPPVSTSRRSPHDRNSNDRVEVDLGSATDSSEDEPPRQIGPQENALIPYIEELFEDYQQPGMGNALAANLTPLELVNIPLADLIVFEDDLQNAMCPLPRDVSVLSS